MIVASARCKRIVRRELMKNWYNVSVLRHYRAVSIILLPLSVNEPPFFLFSFHPIEKKRFSKGSANVGVRASAASRRSYLAWRPHARYTDC